MTAAGKRLIRVMALHAELLRTRAIVDALLQDLKQDIRDARDEVLRDEEQEAVRK